jgi:hypothetical protein
MTARRLRTPANDGGILLEPPKGASASLLHANQSLLADWDYDFQGRSARVLRAMVRAEVIKRARDFLSRHGVDPPLNSLPAPELPSFPLVVTGHQPELFHPGVWIKNFAAAALARANGGAGLNLIIDSDIPKASSIQVPRLQEGHLDLERVEFDRWGGDTPYEDLRVQEEDRLSSFPARVRQSVSDLVADPLLDQFWPRVLARRGTVLTLGSRFALARREVEATWGRHNLELPQSAVCQTEGFLWFACHILAQLPRYQQVYNSALAEYRAARRIRSKNHPVPALARLGDWLEAPFWVWRAEEPRRRALLARQRGRVMELRIAGEESAFIELVLGPESEACCAVERLRGLAESSVRLRTRALTTTMFARFLLADLFIHGLGGSKYEELGDEIARRFFGVEPPGFMTLSMTLWLGLASDAARNQDLVSINQQLRDLTYNPDRHLDEPYSETIRNLIRAKLQAIAGPVSSRQQRVTRFWAIRGCNEALEPWVRVQRTQLLQLQASMMQRIRSGQIARNREFAAVLHSAPRLREILVGTVEDAWPSG